MRTKGGLGAVLVLLGVGLTSSAAFGTDAAALKGAWLGAEAGNPIKRALIVEALEAGEGTQLTAHSRFGSTGYHAKQLMLTAVRLEVRPVAGSLELATRTSAMELLIKPDRERLQGTVRYLASGRQHEILYERVAEELLAKIQFNRIPVARGSQITVLYMGTPDCSWCRKWEAQSRPGFVASEHYKSLRFLEAKGSTLRAGVREEHFPDQDRDLARQITIGGRIPVPSFAVAVDRNVVASYFGVSAWTHRIEPLARELVAWRAASAN